MKGVPVVCFPVISWSKNGNILLAKKGVLLMIMIAVCNDIASFVDDVEKMIKNVGKNLDQDFYVAKYVFPGHKA